MNKNKLFALGLLILGMMVLSACTSSSSLTGSTSWPGVTAENDIVYAANGSFVEAVQNGSKLWSYPESANNRLTFYAAPAVDENHVYAGTYSNQLHVLDKSNGMLVVSAEVGNSRNKIIASPLVAEDKVIVLSSGGMVSAYPTEVSGDSLAPLWQTTLSNELWVTPEYDNGVLYVASMDKKMNLLDIETGELTRSIDISGAIMSTPTLADGKLYFSTLAKEVDEMDLESGELRSLLTTDGEIWASPLLMGDKIVAADMNGIVYIVDAASGNQVWKSERLTADKIGFIASPVALDEETFLLVDESGQIMTYDLDGKSIGQRTMNVSTYTTPVILDNGSFVVIPISSDGEFRVYTADLKEDWVYSRTESSATATPEPTETAQPEATAESGKED